jgi:DNA-directed RNA polymerase subunit K/omega
MSSKTIEDMDGPEEILDEEIESQIESEIDSDDDTDKNEEISDNENDENDDIENIEEDSINVENVEDEDDEIDIDDLNEDSDNEDINKKEDEKTTNKTKTKTIKKTNKTLEDIYLENEMEDDDEDEEDNEDENYLQKFNKEINKNYIEEVHPECVYHNYNEIAALAKVIRDKNNNIIDPLHKTIPFLTKYEKTRIIGQRAKQINSGAKPFVNVPQHIIDGAIIAELELKQKKIPFIIRRPIPGGGSEYWSVKDLEII